MADELLGDVVSEKEDNVACLVVLEKDREERVGSLRTCGAPEENEGSCVAWACSTTTKGGVRQVLRRSEPWRVSSDIVMKS